MPGPVWTGGKSRPHRDSIPDRPARSQSPRRNILHYVILLLHSGMAYVNRNKIYLFSDFFDSEYVLDLYFSVDIRPFGVQYCYYYPT